MSWLSVWCVTPKYRLVTVLMAPINKPADSVVDCWTSYNLSSEESRVRHANRPDLCNPNQHVLHWVILLLSSAQTIHVCHRYRWTITTITAIYPEQPGSQPRWAGTRTRVSTQVNRHHNPGLNPGEPAPEPGSQPRWAGTRTPRNTNPIYQPHCPQLHHMHHQPSPLRPPSLFLGSSIKENLGEMAEKNMMNPRTRTHICFIVALFWIWWILG